MRINHKVQENCNRDVLRLLTISEKPAKISIIDFDEGKGFAKRWYWFLNFLSMGRGKTRTEIA